ncbi:hypothetical protein PLICRDRAFT_40694 [Plicaturopsis crispa FD-325 SS-3]|nr:hypothetical protein PLICRDRAFT_40694 [Plicaturopsis crispa FD-325 SS-3]
MVGNRLSLDRRCAVTKSNASAFVSLLASPCCTLPTTIPCLRFQYPVRLDHVFSEINRLRVQTSSEDHLPSITFNALRRLELRGNHRISALPSEAWSAFTSFAPNLRELHISARDPAVSIPRMIELISSFPGLEILYLNFTHPQRMSDLELDPSTAAMRVPAGLHTLNIYQVDSRTVAIIKWMLSSPTIPAFRSFDFTVLNGSSTGEPKADVVATVRSFIRHAGASLENLSITVGIHYNILWPSLDLSQNTYLHFFAMEDLSVYMHDPWAGPEYLPGILARITSAQITEFHFNVYHCRDADDVARATECLHAVDRLLALPQFSKLCTLVVRTTMEGPIVETVRECLAACDRRKILAVDTDLGNQSVWRLESDA